MGCMKTISRIILVFFNLIFFLSSALLLAFGIAAKVNQNSIVTIFSYILPNVAKSTLQDAGVNLSEIVVSNAVFMIVIGVIGLVISGLGFFGACCSVRVLLVIYAVLMILLLLGEIALIIFAAVYPDTFKGFIQQNMNKTLVDGFRSELRVNASNAVILPTGAIELAWASVQISERCCGAQNYTDYQKFTWNNTNLVANIPVTYAKVPISCCLIKGNSTNKLDSINSQSFVNIQGCLNGQPDAINSQNCYDAVKSQIDQFVRDYKGIAIGIAAGIVGIELILIIMAFVICYRSDDDSKFA